ncbi:MAG: DUF4188 domain-containing protein [Gammaproteobacteria bacterium]|jgi:hypothetical protein
MINKQRMEPTMDEPFIVFIVGFRINNYWKVHKWLPVRLAFRRMLNELAKNPHKGCLGYEYWGGRTPMCIQYWTSYDALLAYARDKGAKHFPAWFAYNSRRSDGSVGLWHEVYTAQPGDFKAVYKNMPPFGLGRATALTTQKTTAIHTSSSPAMAKDNKDIDHD